MPPVKRQIKRQGKHAAVKKRGRKASNTWKMQQEFLKAYRYSFNVANSAALAGINRATVYNWINDDETFKAEFEMATEGTIDELESRVMHRAIHGTLKPIYQGGEFMCYVREHRVQREALMLAAHRRKVYGKDSTGNTDSPEAIALKIRAAQDAMKESMTSGDERDVG